MKKKIILFFVLTFIFLFLVNLLNINRDVFNAVGNHYYNDEIYDKSMAYHIISQKITSDDKIKYNIGNDLYKSKEYLMANLYYSGVTEDFSHRFSLLHNTGNTNYRLGEKESEIEVRVKHWEKSILNYEDALRIKQDEETQKNLEFVKKKLEELMQQQEQQEEQQEQESESDEKGSEDNSGKKSGEEANSKENPESSEGQETGELSQEEEAYLEKYKEFLKQQQGRNSDSFNKQENGSDKYDMFFDFFSNDIRKLDEIDRGGEKDW